MTMAGGAPYRWKSAFHTQEDWAILCLPWSWTPLHNRILRKRSLLQDRRDATLMWGWQCQEMETLHMTRLERLQWLGIV